MKGPGVLQRPVDRACGGNHCVTEDSESDEEEENGDGGYGDEDDEDENEDEDETEDDETDEEDDSDETFKLGPSSKNQQRSSMTTRRTWDSENQPEKKPEQPNVGKGNTNDATSSSTKKTSPKAKKEEGSTKVKTLKRTWAQCDSESSLSPSPSDDENPFGDDFPPAKPFRAPGLAATSTLSRKTRSQSAPATLTAQFGQLNIIGRRALAPAWKNSPHHSLPNVTDPNGDFAADAKGPSEPQVEEKGSLEKLSPEYSSGETAIEDGIFRKALSHLRAIRTPLKSAIKNTDYVYVRPGRITRSQSAQVKRRGAAKTQNGSRANQGTNQNPQPLAPSAPGPTLDGPPPAKRVRFAEGCKEESEHVVLALPPRKKRNEKTTR
ncbi:hypothetical protein TWF281_003783 [Arthrobotrys megalospora]